MNQVLARKWRPHSFDEVVGQPHAVQALSNALNKQYLHHAYLFTGTRGIGKTTLARIVAKCLNCEKGISANPCGECTACQEIDAGRFPDLYEVDAASRTKVEDTRELLDNAQYAPTKGRFKIYLIDEVHMLSGHSFNALLKTLEEPPAHVKFLLATTDPQRLPATVLSRCLQFHLLQMPVQQIADHLQVILKKEKIEYEDTATLLLGKAANGSMRDALSLLDQSIAYGNGKVLNDDVKAMLGTIEPTALYEILNALNTQDANALLAAATKLADQGSNFSHALADLLSMLHQIALLQIVPNASTEETTQELQALAKNLNREDVQLYYQIGLLGQRDLPSAPTPRAGFEMTLIRMLAFTPQEISGEYPTTPKQTTQKTTKTVLNPQSATQFESWNELLMQLNLQGATKALAQQCRLEELTEVNLHLLLDPKQKPLLQKKQIQRIQESLCQYFNKPMTVTIDIDTPNAETPAALSKQQQTNQKTKAEQAIYNDEKVQRIMQVFDAKVIKDSIVSYEQH